MNAPIRPNPTMLEALRDQAGAIYNAWINGNKATAAAMLSQVPHHRTAYVVMTMTVLAIHEGKQYDFSQFIARATS
jgi:hypothetical protein